MIKQNNLSTQSQSIKFNIERDSKSSSHKKNSKPPVTIEYYGIKDIKKEQQRELKGLPKYESTFIRKKSKIEELKRQSLKRMHRRGSRGYVILNDKPSKQVQKEEDDKTLSYKEAQTASIYFHNSGVRKFERGEKILIQPSEVKYLEQKMQNRVKRTLDRKQTIESKMTMKQKLVDLKSKRQLENYKKRSRDWKMQESKSTKMIKRDNSRTLYSAIDNYREKREERELAEKIAPMVEKYGENRLWEMNLRRKEQIEARKTLHDKGDIFENNCYISIDDPLKEVEVIRRPKSSYSNYKRRD